MPGKGYMMWKLNGYKNIDLYIRDLYLFYKGIEGENFECYKYLSTHEYVIQILIKRSTSNYHMFTTYVSPLQTIK